MDAWFRQIVIEGAAVASFVLLALYLPWFPMQLFFLVLLFYVLWLLFRNPRFFYRRLVHAVLWVLLLPPLGDLSIRLFGHSGETAGILGVAIEFGRGASSALLAGLAALFVAADLFSGWLDGRHNRHRIDIEVQEAVLYTERAGGYDARVDLFVTAPAGAPAAIGAGARLRGAMWSRWVEADVYPRADAAGAQVPLAADETIDLRAGQSVRLLLSGEAEAGGIGRWLFWWSQRLRWLRLSYGAVQLAAVPASETRKGPLTFRLQAPEVPPAQAAAAPSAPARE